MSDIDFIRLGNMDTNSLYGTAEVQTMAEVQAVSIGVNRPLKVTNRVTLAADPG